MISSSSNPRVKQVVQWQNKAKERRAAGIFLAEGFKMYGEAPEDAVREVYVTREALEKAEAYPGVREKLARTGYELVDGGVFEKMSDTRSPQGILCVVERPQYKLERLLSAADPLLVAVEDLQDPGNLGTIIRTGEGAGITGIIVNGGTVDVYNPKVIRATMGSIYRVPIVCEEDLVKTVERLHARGICTYGAHLAGERYYDSFSFRGGTAFFIGNEGNGLSRELAGAVKERLKIPMEGRVESLNAAVSAALLMYEARRQRA